MSWESIDYERADQSGPAIEALCTRLAALHANGGVVLARLAPSDAAEFDAAVQDSVRPTAEALLDWLRNPSVRAAIPELQIPSLDAGAEWEQAPRLQATHALGMEAELTYRLLVGGAYQAWDDAIDAARDLARQFVEALVGERLLEATVLASRTAWTPWFHQVAWDLSFFVRDVESRALWVLAVTDSD